MQCCDFHIARRKIWNWKQEAIEVAKRLIEWNEEDYAMTLPELKEKVFLGADPDQVQETLEAVLAIKK